MSGVQVLVVNVEINPERTDLAKKHDKVLHRPPDAIQGERNDDVEFACYCGGRSRPLVPEHASILIFANNLPAGSPCNGVAAVSGSPWFARWS